LKNDFIYYFSIILINILNRLPRKLALGLGGFCGEIWYLLSAGDRAMAEKQLAAALGLHGRKLQVYARECLAAMGRNLADAIRMKGWSAEFIGRLVEVEGFENIDRAYRQGKGVIALTGHIGNFELIAAWFAFYKKYKVSVIGRKLYDERFDRLLIAQRESLKVANIASDSSVKAIMEALKDGHALGVLLDQDTHRVRGYFAEFFGRLALTPAGPLYIARKMDVPVVPLAIYRKPDDTYYMRILPPLKFEWTENKEQDVLEALVQCNRALEKLIRYDPTQWVWIHDRWRTRPPIDQSGPEKIEAVIQ
jgi:KDO2-lipid IV(A) lauroyltransferase